VAPPLSEFALKFGPPEYFSLTLFGLLMPLSWGRIDPEGLIMVVMGLLLGSVGLDPISGAIRFTWGLHMLQEGSTSSPWPWACSGWGKSSTTWKRC